MSLTFNPFTGNLDFTGSGGGGGTSPGGPNTAVQFNNAGAFGGSANLVWTGTVFTDKGLLGVGSASDPVGNAVQVDLEFTGDSTTGPNGNILTNFFDTAAANGQVIGTQLNIATPSNSGTHRGYFGFQSLLAHSGTGTIASLHGGEANLSTISGGVVTTGYGYDAAFQIASTGHFTTAYSFFAYDLGSGNVGGTITNPYYFWADSNGVFRIREDATFNSVGQAIPALYNPQFTRYTPGAANFERIVLQWESNIGVLTTEAGGTGTLRSLRLGDASVPLILGGYTTNGFVKTSSGTGAVTIDTNTYLTTAVTSVGLALPNIFSVSGSPVTTTGTLTGALATQSANLVWAGPSSGAAAAPTFRSLVAADLPGAALTRTNDTNVTVTLGGSPTTALVNAASLTLGWSGQLGLVRGGTNADLSGTGGSNQFLKQSSVGAAVTVGTIASSDLPVNGANPTASLGLSAINGSATTWMRSDAAPALSVSIVPTWTGAHTWQAISTFAPSSAGLGNAVTITGATETTNTNIPLSITQTWNASGVTFTATKLNITNTASAVGSLLQDLQLGGTSRWNVGLGSWTATSGTNVAATLAPSFAPTSTSTMVAQGLKIAPTINYSAGTPGAGNYEALKIAVTETANPTGTNYLLRASAGSAGTTDKFVVNNSGQVAASGEFDVGSLSSPTVQIGAATVKIGNGGTVQWGPGAANSTMNLVLTWEAANILGLRNSTNAQIFDIYNTYTSSTNFERLMLDWATTANVAMIYTQKGSGGGTARVLQLNYGGTTTSAISIPITSGDVTFGGGAKLTGLIDQYNAINTVGWGVPAIYGNGRSTGQTAAVASVAAYTVGAADGSFEVSANVLVTASVTNSFTVTCAYTDESNTSRTLTLTFSQITGTLLTTITNVTGTGAYEGVPLHIRCKASTSITIATTGTFTSVTYNVEGTIRQLS